MALSEETESGLLRRLSDETRFIVWGAMGLVVAAAWTLLATMARGGEGTSFIAALCRPGGAALSPYDLAAGVLMWSAMALAMMLPTAAPMISAYLDIAGAARRKRMRVVPAGVLAAGYVTVWLGFSLIAAGLQAGFRAAGALDPWTAALGPVAAGLVLMLAGAYQFTPLKDACLAKCQRPMPFFMANWSEDRLAVFRLGLMQGLWCLGCCWALMLAMFATGLMNLVWMAGLGLVMMAEKLYAESRALSRGAGFVFLAGGLAVLAAGLAG